MTAVDLVGRVVALLTTALADMRLEPADGGAARAPYLVAGWLAPPRADDETRPPLVLVRAPGGSDDEDATRTTILIVVELYSEDVAGWQDATNVLQRSRGALTQTRTLGPHHMELPLTWALADEQPQPTWIGTITTTWLSPRAEWLGETE